VTHGHLMGVGAGRQRVRVGLLAEEGVSFRMAKALGHELPQLLNERLSSEVEWQVDHRCESLPLDEYGEIPLIDLAEKRQGLGWDIAILMTDLPRRTGTQPIVSDYSVELRVGLLSMPALGAWQVRRRTRALVVHLAGHLLEDQLNLDGSCTHLGRHFGRRGRLTIDRFYSDAVQCRRASMARDGALCIFGCRSALW